jgi:hypothetical protein
VLKEEALPGSVGVVQLIWTISPLSLAEYSAQWRVRFRGFLSCKRASVARRGVLLNYREKSRPMMITIGSVIFFVWVFIAAGIPEAIPQ